MTSTRLLTVAEFAERVGVSPHTVRTWMKRRQITGYLLSPRVLRIEEGELVRLMARTRQPQQAPTPGLSGQVPTPAVAAELVPEPEPMLATEDYGPQLGERERLRLAELARARNGEARE
jgi:hypothetical protein